MSVQCTVELMNGQRVEKTAQVTGHGKEYLSSLSAILSTLKEDVNTVLSEQVEKEKQQPLQPLKRPTEDEEGKKKKGINSDAQHLE